MNKYDSREDTLKHIRNVAKSLKLAAKELEWRAKTHDISKLSDPEKSYFDKLTPLLKDSTYGSEEYFNFLEEMKPALEHHYKENAHHPDHWDYGILDMSLIDLLEMIIDWKASAERQTSANIFRSIELNQKRFGYTDELKQILINTVNEINNLNGNETKATTE